VRPFLEALLLGVGPAFSPYLLQLDGQPWKLSAESMHRLQDSFRPHSWDSCKPSPLPFVQEYEPGCATGHHDGTSLPSRSTRYSKSTDVSRACKTASPKMHSLVILATNTQVVSRRRPIFTKVYFRMKSPLCYLQDMRRGQVYLGQSCRNAQRGDHHCYSCVNGHTA
jgi:hypothetical protein